MITTYVKEKGLNQVAGIDYVAEYVAEYVVDYVVDHVTDYVIDLTNSDIGNSY